MNGFEGNEEQADMSFEETDKTSADSAMQPVTVEKDEDTKLVDVLMKASRLMRQRLASLSEERKEAEEKKNDQVRILKLLQLKPKMTQKEMAELLGMRLRILDEVLSEMQQSGYVNRELPQEPDMRAVAVSLSSAGRDAVEQGSLASDKKELVPELSQEDRQDLIDLLSEVNSALESLGLSDENRSSHSDRGFDTNHGGRDGRGYHDRHDSYGHGGSDNRGHVPVGEAMAMAAATNILVEAVTAMMTIGIAVMVVTAAVATVVVVRKARATVEEIVAITAMIVTVSSEAALSAVRLGMEIMTTPIASATIS